MNLKKIFFSIIVIIICSQAICGQQSLRVYVNDQSGTPISGVIIHLMNKNNGIKLSATSNASGRLDFNNLQAYTGYELGFDGNEQFKSDYSTKFNIRSLQDATIHYTLINNDLVLPELIVSASANQSKTYEISQNLDRIELEKIPYEGRDINKLLSKFPNVGQATGFFPEAPPISINGANSLYTSYLIDGMDNNERFLGGMKFNIPIGFVQNIDVLTSNYSSEYGNSGNGVVNISTPSGSNDFGIDYYLIHRPGGLLDSDNGLAQRDQYGNQVKEGFKRWQMGVSSRGAIKKDKTFYYFNFEYTKDNKDNVLKSDQLGNLGTIRGHNKYYYVSANLDHKWNTNFKSKFRANIGNVSIERQGGGLDGGITFPSAGNDQDRNSLHLALKNSYDKNNIGIYTNLQYSTFHWNYGNPKYPNSPQAFVLAPSGVPFAVLGHPGFVFDEREKTFQLQQKFKFNVGNHVMKAGFELISSRHKLFGGANHNGNYIVQLNDNQLNTLSALSDLIDLSPQDLPKDIKVISYTTELQTKQFGKTQNVFSAYLEDDIQLTSKDRISYGLRYMVDNMTRGGSNNLDLNNLAPRISWNHKIKVNHSIRCSYGRYFDKINYAIVSDALQQNSISQDYRLQLSELIRLGLLPDYTDLDKITFDGNHTATVSNISYLDPPTNESLVNNKGENFAGERRILNPDGYQNPRTDQISFGYQWTPNNKWEISLDVIYHNTKQLYRLVNLNAASVFLNNDPNNIKLRSIEEADLTRPIPIFDQSYSIVGGQTLTGVARNVIMSETGGKAKYYATNLGIKKNRNNDRYDFMMNYTLSSLKNNTEDINFRAMNGNDFDQEYSHSINDRTHIFNIWGNFYWTPKLKLGIAALVQSGQVINRIPDGTLLGTTDLNGDGASYSDAYIGNSDRFPGEGRNSDRLPWSKVVDFNIAYQFEFFPFDAQLQIDVFNVFNSQNLSGYSNNSTQSNQIQVGPKNSSIVKRNAGPPRQFQLGLYVKF